MLVTFDTLVHFGDQEQRPEAALFLRDAAALCSDPAQKERLLRAADSVIASQPVCADTGRTDLAAGRRLADSIGRGLGRAARVGRISGA